MEVTSPSKGIRDAVGYWWMCHTVVQWLSKGFIKDVVLNFAKCANQHDAQLQTDTCVTFDWYYTS